ncbi:MAG: beta-agarase [Verrucomicrobiota bacterium]
MKNSIWILASLVPVILVAEKTDQVDVRLEPTVIRNIGGVTEFDRDQFVTVHESFGSTDLAEEDLDFMENVLEARYGRDGGLLSWQAPNVKADPNNPDMPDVEEVKRVAKEYRAEYDGRRMTPRHMREVVLCTHPELMHAMAANSHAEWGPRTNEGIAEYTAQFMKHAFDDNDRPKYLEVFNEPFVKAKKIGTTVEALSEQHNVVAKRVKELNPDVMVGGYAAAWIEVEDRNFDHWDGWQKTFMDIAGENMDFFSYHIYDGVNVQGSPRVRTGSNSEAIMDLIDSYSHMKFGVAKPILITEYGKIPEGNMGMMAYDPARSAGMLYSINGQHMTYMDHPDRILKAIPFVLGKAEWTYVLKGEGKPGEANVFLLWRRDEDGEYVTTDLTLFYEFWKGIEGEWRMSESSNPDVRVHLLADDNQLVVALANLDHAPKTVNLSGLENVKAKSVELRQLTTHTDLPLVASRSLDRIPSSVELADGMGAILVIDLEEPINAKSMVKEHRIYATDYLQDIVADQPIEFRFVDTPTGAGSAILRMSPGRELGKAVLPTSVTLNGQALELPSNWAGDDQAGRKNFFGMIEIPVSMDLLNAENVVEIIYPDTGGKVASVVLQVNRVEST